MIDVEIEDVAWTAALPDAERLARAAAEAVLDDQDFAADGGAMVLLLTNDLAVQALNARFRGQDKPTNVLSFPAPQNLEGFFGDIALAFETCVREADEQGKPLAHHLQHLVAHGVLHLLGYDHQDEAEADEMEELERRILDGLGIPDPYAAGEGEHGGP